MKSRQTYATPGFRESVAVLTLALLLVLVWSGLSRASEEGADLAWNYMEEAGGDGPLLYFGARDNAEIMYLFLSCAPSTSALMVEFIDASEKLVVGNEACIDIRAGRAFGSFCGAATPNGLSGIPGVIAIAPVNHEVFAEFKAANRNVTFDISGTHHVLPLAGIDSKIQALLDYCRPNW